MTIDEIKALPRDKDGVFEIDSFDKAAEIFATYISYETNENKKAGYPDIMAQMRTLCARMSENKDFSENTGYLKLLLAAVSVFSPEIYENYRELLDMFRTKVKEVLLIYYDNEKGFKAGLDASAVSAFKAVVNEACKKDLLLAEKYMFA